MVVIVPFLLRLWGDGKRKHRCSLGKTYNHFSDDSHFMLDFEPGIGVQAAPGSRSFAFSKINRSNI